MTRIRFDRLGGFAGLRSALLRMLLALTLAGCGGGAGLAGGDGGSGGVGSGGTGTFAVGPISGYGSILVNGIRYDLGQLSAAPRDDDDGERAVATLQLGTVVRVEAGPIDFGTSPPRAVARTVRVSSEVVGSVESVVDDAAGRTLRVAGQTVRIQAGTTVLDERLSAGAPAPGDWIEVYGAIDGAVSPARIVATRIEPHAADGARVRGTVTDIGASALRIGSGVYGFGGGTPPAGAAVGSLLQLRLQGSAGQGWQVATVADAPTAPAEAAAAHVEGRVTSIVSSDRFVVDDLAVDAGGLSTAGLTLGRRVVVEGPIRAGVLHAEALQFKRDDDRPGQAEPYEFHGTIATADTVAATFSLSGRSELFRLGPGTRYEGGGAARAVAGVRLEMRGTLNADGRSVDVVFVHFED